MFFLNLSLPEFMALFSVASAVVVGLYLLDRSRRRIVAPTLRFWQQATRPVESTRRRRITQWPSLALILAAIACLLAASGHLRLGSPEDLSRDHVLLLDTSAWSGSQFPGAQRSSLTVLDAARRQALAYIRAIPSRDRVLIVYADSLANPATGFESDRVKLQAAIERARPSHAALNLTAAFDFARHALRRNAIRPGEIVYAGPGRTVLPDTGAVETPPGFRWLPVAAPQVNAGIRRVGLRPASSGAWNVLTVVRNYSTRELSIDLAVAYGQAPVGSARLRLAPGTEKETSFEVRTRSAGIVEARIRAAGDQYPGDDAATVELPEQPVVRVLACTDRDEALRPLLASHPAVQVAFSRTSDCPAAPDDAVALYDGFVPAQPAARAVILNPPATSPIPVRSTAGAVTINNWSASHPIASGIRRTDLRADRAIILAPAPTDTVIAASAEGPLIAIRESDGRKVAVFGVDPSAAPLRYEISAPLVIANTLRWMSPAAFRRWELQAASPGQVSVPLGGLDPATLKVTSAQGAALPYSVEGNTLRFFSGGYGAVRVTGGDVEQVFNMDLPAVPETVWLADSATRRGVPRASEHPVRAWDLWPWLAAAAALLLGLEWYFFAPRRSVPTVRSAA